jgi:cyanophycinase-like exopeptidase
MKKILLLVFMICQIGASQNYIEFHTGSTDDVITTPEPGICLMGGASESDEAMVWFLNKANGGDVLVLRASGSDGYNDYFYSELGVSINSVTTFVINNSAGAIDPYVLERVNEAEAIWFAGGNQYNYVSYFKDNAMETALNTFINVKRGVIGGTSAGMAILGSSYFDAENGTVTNAQALSNPYHNRMSLGYNDFLEIPFLENVITDTHYDDPDRRGRHTAFLARFAKDNNLRPFGIACNEYTAVCINSNGRAFVYGDYPNYEEHAFFIQSNCALEVYDPENCTEGQPLDWSREEEAVKVYKVPGTTTGTNYFDLTDWKTGVGGTWQNWHVTNGVFDTGESQDLNCDALGIEYIDPLNVLVYPNPFKDYLMIASSLKNSMVTLYSITGKQITLFTEPSNKIDTTSLLPGIYLLKISTQNRSKIFKIVKE